MRSTESRAELLAAKAASGEWTKIDPTNVRVVDGLSEKIQSFRSLDYPAGARAERFLRTDAVEPGASVVTMALVGEQRIEGFIATNFTEVELTRADAANLRLRYRSRLPAFRLAWIARHRESSVQGLELFAAAWAMAMEAAERGGLVALVIEPADSAVSELWKREPYRFEECEPDPNSRSIPRLWLPLKF